MRKGCLQFKGIVATSLFLFFCFLATSQSVPPPKVETPNVASLEKFGEIPVDLSTGVPNIAIPLHTLSYGKINVPVSLRYHPGSLRLAQHPGWVGSGWDLQVGGAITRRVRYYPDELYQPVMPGDLRSTYFPEPVATPPISGSESVDNATDWNTDTRLASYFVYYDHNNGTIADVVADEFSFNFLGYSGKFYYVSPSKGWQVVCDQKIKVELTNSADPRLSSNSTISTIVNQYNEPSASGHLYLSASNLPSLPAPRFFNGFTLTVPDGTKYYFGGVKANGDGIGIEFSTAYGSNEAEFGVDTWLLTKIIDTDNHEVNFNYSASYPICDLGFSYDFGSWNCQVVTAGPLSNASAYKSISGPIEVKAHHGTLNLPLYLDNITCSNETVTFNRNITNNCLRFPNDVLTYVNLGPNPPTDPAANKFALERLGYGQPDPNCPNPNTNPCPYQNGIDNLQWEQLNSIAVKKSNNQTYRNYQFTYSNDPSQRLTLNAFQALDNTNNQIEKYTFAYNNFATQLLYYDANFTDHWGFYNGKNVGSAGPNDPETSASSIYGYKQTNPSLVTQGTLSQITYPTGGSTKFFWQAHDYSQVVSNARNSLNSQTGYAGGCRIGEIQSYLADGSLALDKKYYYVKGYNAYTSPTALPSSGILNGTPTYNMNLNDRYGIEHNQLESINVVSLNSFASYGYNSQGSYIGYEEVAEVDADGSYTRNFFTNYGPDQNGVSHYDIPPAGSLGWKIGDVYYAMSTLDMERGKPTSILKYTNSNVLVQKTAYTYRNDAARFNDYIKLITLTNIFSGCTYYDALVLVAATKQFTYSYYPVSQLITTYDQQGKNPATQTVSFTYNTNNLISTKTETSSLGERVVTAYKYPNDFPADATAQAMVSANLLSTVIETSVTKSAIPVSFTHANYYSPYAGIYVPQSIQMRVGSNPVETRQEFYRYDAHGNVQEQSKENGTHEVYLYGYNSQYLVAKITGSTYDQVVAAISSSIGMPYLQNQLDNAASQTDAQIKSLLHTLRSSLPNAFVTTYTYSPITGVTSMTDPRNQTTYYQYDAFQRLKLITDNDGNIVKTFNYNYQN